MARIVELVLILNGLGGIATYLGFKVRRTRQAAKRGVNRVAGLAGVEVYHEEDDAEPPAPDPRLVKELNADGTEKRSKLAKFGDAIREGGEGA